MSSMTMFIKVCPPLLQNSLIPLTVNTRLGRIVDEGHPNPVNTRFNVHMYDRRSPVLRLGPNILPLCLSF